MRKNNKKLLSNEEMALFCEQFAMTLDAGLNHTDGISVILEDAVGEEGREILDRILTELHSGKKLHEACEQTGVFPKYALDMMEIGEASGKLDEVMHSLAFYYNREENIAKGIKSAVTYPFIIIFMMFIVILVLIIKVLPIFNQVFQRLGSGLDGISLTLMNFGKTISNYSLIFVSILVLLVILYFVMAKSAKGKACLNDFFSRFVLTRGLFDIIAAGRFASGMALTLNAGLRPETSLEMIKRLVDNKRAEKKVSDCLEYIRQGESFQDALVKAGIFSNLYSRMISVSGKSGTMDRALEKISKKYEEEIDVRINNIISILEPTLVIVFSVIVCLILLSVMMPLMSIMTSIGG